jgi:hypothetical protein
MTQVCDSGQLGQFEAVRGLGCPPDLRGRARVKADADTELIGGSRLGYQGAAPGA